jgi:glycosyltransferase involved in cell wall biosynthesis
MKLSVVMPCFKEAPTVAAQIDAVLAVEIADERVCDREIVVVDDGSTDGTTEILATFDDPRVKVIRHAANRGKGAALQTGFAAATGDILLIQDADSTLIRSRRDRTTGASEPHARRSSSSTPSAQTRTPCSRA